jgi:hypothetical protein
MLGPKSIHIYCCSYYEIFIKCNPFIGGQRANGAPKDTKTVLACFSPGLTTEIQLG